MEKTLHRNQYISPDWFEKERERIFSDQWFCVGRVEEILAPGDHLVCDVLGESILVTRTREDTLAAYANLCRHRGSRLSSAPGKPSQADPGPSGTFRGAIQCPYHAWTYNFEGDLRAAPFLDEGDGLQKADLPLHKVGLEEWGGFVWIHLTPDRATPLGGQFQESTDYLKNYPLADLQVSSRIVYEVGANWNAIV
jgi:Rieske 2Fe-2S family protein